MDKSESTGMQDGLGDCRARVRERQLDIHFQHAPCRLAVHALIAAVIVWVLWGVVPRVVLLGWLAATAIGLATCILLVLVLRSGTDRRARRLQERYVMASGAIMGMVWGVGGIVLFPADSFAHQMLLLCLYMSLAAGSLASSVYRPQRYGFFALVTLPIAIVFLSQGTQLHTVAGIAMAMFLVLNLVCARQPGRNVMQMLRLQIHNDHLVKQLNLQRAEAERANVAKSRFLAAASHDLRQPLYALTLFASALDVHAGSEPLRGIARNIRTSLGAMEDLFSALLDISQLDAGVLEPELTHFSLRRICQRLANDFAPTARAKGLRLRLPASDLTVHSDAALLERILRNLVANAIRYTEHGEVRVMCTQRHGAVCIEVADTGIGIAPNQQREIFDEFHQLANPERNRSKGLGLGLAIVDRLARLLECPIDLRSAPGRGSRFAITVPAGDAAAGMRAHDGIAAAATGDVADLQVLVVEDEAGVRDGIGTLLAAWGCEACLVDSLETASAALRHFVADALIVDLRLGGGQCGLDVIRQLREQLAVPVAAVILTAETDGGHLRNVRASAEQVLHKPVAPAALRAFLRNVRASRGAREPRGSSVRTPLPGAVALLGDAA